MQTSHFGVAVYLLLVATGCGGAVGAPDESTGVVESAQSKPPFPGGPPRPLGTLTTFDDVPSGTPIETHYAGVTFSAIANPGVVGPPGSVEAVLADPAAPAVLCSPVLTPLTTVCPPSGNTISVGPDSSFSGAESMIRAAFSSPKTWVSIMTRSFIGNPEELGDFGHRPYLDAFDTDGIPIETVYGTATQGGFTNWETLRINAPAGRAIGSVVFSTEDGMGAGGTLLADIYAEFDNLTYSYP